MPRQILTKTNTPTPYPIAGQLITWATEDIANHSRFLFTGREILLIWNSHATTTFTYTIASVPDAQGRSKDITSQNVLAGEIHTIGPFTVLQGWMQADGYLYIDSNNAAVKFAVLQLP